ncbi:hypothetical protein ACP70R_010353 [Stipagrostis hirtigluma subsp. patula]
MDCSSGNQILPETSSRWLTHTITATHNFEVTDFSQLGDVGARRFVSSSTFTVGGRDWSIRLYPDNCSYVSIFLCVHGDGQAVRAKFSFSLLDRDDKVLGTKALCMRNHTYTFKPCYDSVKKVGWKKFIQRSKLQELLSVSNNDSFTIRGVLTIILYRKDASTIVVSEPSLHQDLALMLKDQEVTDVTFSVGDQVFHAHSFVLAARSPVFRARLYGPMKENTTKCIEIDDVEPLIFEGLLHFVYTDSLPDNHDNVDKISAMQHLLVAADRYGLERLKMMCEAKLCSWIDVQSVANTLALAEQHHCVQLKDTCMRFISWRDVIKDVKETEGFKHLRESCPLIVKEIIGETTSAAAE